MDRRVQRTRQALVDAFNRLVFDRRHRDIRIADIVAYSGVGRSTFYDHYSNAEALHMDALRRPFAALADAAVGRGDEAAVTYILAHFWEYRQRARRSFSDRTMRLLTTMVEERLAGQLLWIATGLAARQLAAAVHAPILAWLAGEAASTPEVLARAICFGGRTQIQALRA